MILPPHCHRYGSHKQRDVCSADYHHQRYHVPHILGKGNPSFAFPYSLVVDIERVTPHFLCPTSRKSKAHNFGTTFNRRLIIVRFTVDMYPQSLFLILQGIHPATVQVAQQRQEREDHYLSNNSNRHQSCEKCPWPHYLGILISKMHNGIGMIGFEPASYPTGLEPAMFRSKFWCNINYATSCNTSWAAWPVREWSRRKLLAPK